MDKSSGRPIASAAKLPSARCSLVKSSPHFINVLASISARSRFQTSQAAPNTWLRRDVSQCRNWFSDVLTIYGQQHRFCDGISRRNFLKIGTLGLGGLALPQLLQAESQAGIRKSHKAIIMIYLPGGPPHQD